MKRSIIPGHVKGYTLWLLASLAVFGTIFAKAKADVVLTVLAFTIAFLGDQATHSFQHHEPGPAPTWLEDKLHQHHKIFRLLGIIGATILMMFALA